MQDKVKEGGIMQEIIGCKYNIERKIIYPEEEGRIVDGDEIIFRCPHKGCEDISILVTKVSE